MSLVTLLHVLDNVLDGPRKRAEHAVDPPTEYADWRRDELARKYADTESVPTDDLTAEWGEAMRADERERYRK